MRSIKWHLIALIGAVTPCFSRGSMKPSMIMAQGFLKSVVTSRTPRKLPTPTEREKLLKARPGMSIKDATKMKAVSRYREAPLEESDSVGWPFVAIAFLIMNAVWIAFVVAG